jgi:hypothetical protein
MLNILFSAVLFCVVLKWATLGLSAKLVAVAFYVVIVYVLTIFFFEKPGNCPKSEKVPVNSRNHPKHQISRSPD